MELKHRAKVGLREEPREAAGQLRDPRELGQRHLKQQALPREEECETGGIRAAMRAWLRNVSARVQWHKYFVVFSEPLQNPRERRASTVGNETKRRLAWVLLTCGSAFLASLFLLNKTSLRLTELKKKS